ncbi:hypothetical protein MTR67_047627 [Solanum verrucosum]|uniref:Uncharacterized protein n=1 Tax=Solanum verrucosum TaxID=315347 RepID=A0AAF0ZVS5_SOLVR|nr:hypothetical protein MTR67_047627 [Solanum verrucosum]
MLEAIPNEAEIKEAVFGLNPDSTPGLDGFGGAAYDRVNWNFLLHALKKFGFSDKWVDMIRRLISNVWDAIGRSGTGGICRDHRGKIIMAFARSIGRDTSNMADAKAALNFLNGVLSKWASQCNLGM